MSIKLELSELDLLFALLRFCTEKGRYFTSGERICINQQRGRLLAQQTALENLEPYDYKPYVFPIHLIRKIDFVISKIDTNKQVFYELFNK